MFEKSRKIQKPKIEKLCWPASDNRFFWIFEIALYIGFWKFSRDQNLYFCAGGAKKYDVKMHNHWFSREKYNKLKPILQQVALEWKNKNLLYCHLWKCHQIDVKMLASWNFLIFRDVPAEKYVFRIWWGYYLELSISLLVFGFMNVPGSFQLKTCI